MMKMRLNQEETIRGVEIETKTQMKRSKNELVENRKHKWTDA